MSGREDAAGGDPHRRGHGLSRTVPLTTEQRNWLRANTILPPLFATPIAAILGVVLALIYSRFGASLPAKIFVGISALLLAGMVIAVVMHVRNNSGDLRRGVADVATARLTGKRETGRSPKTLYADFDGIGAVIAPSDVYAALVIGHTYRIAYSPRTRRLWSAEP